MNTIQAIYENGVFRPTVPVNLPDRTSVEVVLPAGVPARIWGEGLRRCAGALADMPRLDGDLHEIIDQRQLDAQRGLPE